MVRHRNNGERLSRDYEPSASPPFGLEQHQQDYMPWFDQAKCLGAGPDVFGLSHGSFALNRHEPGLLLSHELEAARQHCRDCEALDQCANYAVEHEEYNIWAGYTPVELRQIFAGRLSDVRVALNPPEEVKEKVYKLVEDQEFVIPGVLADSLSAEGYNEPVELEMALNAVTALFYEGRLAKVGEVVTAQLNHDIFSSAQKTAQMAIEFYAMGMSMIQASGAVNRHRSWLVGWKQQNPQEFESLLAQALEKVGLEKRATRPRKTHNLDQIQPAIDLYAAGLSMIQASQEVGMSESWLSMWRRNHPEKFESLLVSALEKAGLEERPSKTQQAIDLYARGMTMIQASQEVGKNGGWLKSWKCDHPQKFESLLAQALEKAGLEERITPPREPRNLDRAQQAIELHARGMPMNQASQEVGKNGSWLNKWKYNNPQKFESLLTQSLEKAGLEERKPRNLDRAQQAIELHARGMPMNQASQEMGMSESWLSMWRRNHPQKFESLLAQALKKAGLEERITPPRNLDRVQRAV